MRLNGILAFFMVAVAVVLPAGCKDTVYASRSISPYADEIISSKGAEFELLKEFNPRESRGSISLVGPYDSCLVKRFLTVDDVDNIDGRSIPDGLPDFAGEQIDVLEDAANAPYLSSSGTSGLDLGTVAVKNFIMAMKPVCSIGAFDDESLQVKLPAKVVVFTSVLNSETGHFDIDTLRTASDCSVPVIFPARLVFKRQLERNIDRLHVIVITDSLTALSGVYTRVFDEMAKQKGIIGAGCTAVSMPADSSLNAVVSEYRSAGGNMSVSAILIDGNSVSPDGLKESIEDVLTFQTEANMNTRKFITKDLEVVDICKAVTDECYRILRKNNIFTHNIAYPVSRNYMTVESSNGEGFNLVEKD